MLLLLRRLALVGDDSAGVYGFTVLQRVWFFWNVRFTVVLRLVNAPSGRL